MPEIESPSSARRSTGETQPRHPHREIAELLATAILRARAGRNNTTACDPREVSLDFTGHQRVNTNPSDIEGVRN
jgi:hypothetical protein